MNTKQIIAKHIVDKKLKVKASEFVKAIEDAAKQPNVKLLRSGDVLFLVTVKNDSALLYAINASNTDAFIDSFKKITAILKQMGINFINMRVNNTDIARKIANVAGLKNTDFRLFRPNTSNPYMMGAEI